MRRATPRPRQRQITPHTGDRQGVQEAMIRKVIEKQGGLCILCQGPLGEYVIDHDHVLGEKHGHDPKRGCAKCFRGVVCRRCNSILGWGRDDPEYFMRLAAYILSSRSRA